MALRVLMIRKNLSDKQKALEALRAKTAEFEAREKELEEAIEEVTTDEEREAVENEISEFETQQQQHNEAIDALEREVEELENELSSQEENQNTAPATEVPAAGEEREGVLPMRTRARFFGMDAQERDAFIQGEGIQRMLGEIRSAMKEKRSISGVNYLIPQEGLGLLREIVEDNSKLYKHVDVRRLNGTGRLVIEGQIPEAVWTEMCANLNELDLSFTSAEVDGFKVGGYFKICNATLEDSDIDLAREVFTVLGQAIALALDKAILFGKGAKMPTGILKALEDVDGTPNIVSHAATVKGLDLFKAFVGDTVKADSKYSNSEIVWVMKETTKWKLIQESMGIDASGAIVAGLQDNMPVIGGKIETLNAVPEDVIIAGHYDMYLLAERAGVELSTSEHAFWLADQTGFKGTARYDGKPLETAAFVAIGINGKTPATSDVTFAEDKANASA